ncbi:MAG: hypothetical protein DDT32_01526 [Syntrophomonadaceae bacterium]|nr:hypothetical protein [Bacillota bacterium]
MRGELCRTIQSRRPLPLAGGSSKIAVPCNFLIAYTTNMLYTIGAHFPADEVLRIMNVFTYKTAGGKNLIISYLNQLPEQESAEGFYILAKLEEEGISFLKTLETRQLDGKLWEIKFHQHNRIMYIVLDKDNMYLVHACKKQKGRAEKHELDKARKRSKQLIQKGE